MFTWKEVGFTNVLCERTKWMSAPDPPPILPLGKELVGLGQRRAGRDQLQWQYRQQVDQERRSHERERDALVAQMEQLEARLTLV